jgi:hypothetical protein
MKRLSWFVFFSLIAVSCLDQPDCYQLNNNVAGFGFKIIGGSSDYKEIRSVVSEGAGKVTWDTVGTSDLGVYLDPYSNELSFTVQGYFGPTGIPETKKVTISYQSLVQFVSKECGERHVFSDMKVVSTDFDSIRLLNAVPTRPAGVNFDIYRCPETYFINVDLINDQDVTKIDFISGGYIVPDKSISGVILPVNLNADSSMYVFHYRDNGSNVLTVKYRRTPKTIDSRCGSQVFVDNLTYDKTATDFKTVTMKLDSIYDLPNKVNFEVTR